MLARSQQALQKDLTGIMCIPGSPCFESEVEQVGSLGPNGEQVGIVVCCWVGENDGKLICVSALYSKDIRQRGVGGAVLSMA